MARKRRSSSVSKLSFQLNKQSPINNTQTNVFKSFKNDDKHIMLDGYPGTGKTFIALYNAFQLLEEYPEKYKNITIVRSAVQTRDIGFLPGTLEEKGQIYELPYEKIVNDLYGRGDAYEILKKHYVVNFLLSSYIRGLTLDNTIIIVDEYQNCTFHELSSIITRTGENSKLILSGDIFQRDLTSHKEKDVEKIYKIVDNMKDYFIRFTFEKEDIVRSGLVKDFIIKSTELYPDLF